MSYSKNIESFFENLKFNLNVKKINIIKPINKNIYKKNSIFINKPGKFLDSIFDMGIVSFFSILKYLY